MTLADCTVMVVEDHEFQRRTTLQILANLGAGELLEAIDGESALALMEGPSWPDIVVCDLDMPGMDGVEFFRHLSERSSEAALVIASGLDETVLRAAETTARAYGLSVLGVVQKPLTARRLLEVVGLHRPSAAPSGPPANGAQTRAWQAALDADSICTTLTPRIDLTTGRPVGLLVRALRSERAATTVDAATDLSVTTSPELAGAIADIVIDAACTALRALDSFAVHLDAAVVLPPAACQDLELADRLAARALASRAVPQRLCITFPRQPALPVSAAQLEVLTRLRLRGFGLGVDGFTAGDATFGGKSGLPMTEVTLAPDALAGAPGDRERSEALEATVRALHDQGLTVVVSGCDDTAGRDLAAQVGCDRAQGLAIGAAASLDELVAWAAAQPV